MTDACAPREGSRPSRRGRGRRASGRARRAPSGRASPWRIITGHPDVADGEPPGASRRRLVVQPSVHAARHAAAHRVHERVREARGPGERFAIGVGGAGRADEVLRRERRERQRRLLEARSERIGRAGRERPELGLVLFRVPLEPRGPDLLRGSGPRDHRARANPIGQQRRARERRRSTARPAGDEERGGPEMVGERDGVRGFLRDDAAGAAGRALVARARVRDRADASRRGGRGDLREGHGRARRPHVEDEQRFRVLRSRPAELQRPPAGHPHRLHPHRGSLARTPPRLSVRPVKMGTHARTGSVLGDVRR